jgi:xylulokinase
MGGGAARSPAWTRILADACGSDVEVLAAEGSGMGAVMLAGLAIGRFHGPQEAAAACVSVRDTVPADEEAVRVYRDRAQVFRAAYEALAPVFPGLAAAADGDREG